MSRLIQIAWTLPALWVLLFAARVALADLRGPEHGGRSWSADPVTSSHDDQAVA